MPQLHRMVIESNYLQVAEVQHRLRDELTSAGFDNDSQYAIRISLEEALINAVKHGNKHDAHKQVTVEWTVTPKVLDITVEDQGPGFDRSSVPDPTDEENRDKISGRGILLMESFMDSVEWTKGGRKVRMIRRNGGKGGKSK